MLLLSVALKNHKSGAGLFSEFSGLAASFRADRGDVIAGLASSKAEIQELVELVKEVASQDFASVAAIQKLAGELCSTQTSVMGRFGPAPLKPIY